LNGFPRALKRSGYSESANCGDVIDCHFIPKPVPLDFPIFFALPRASKKKICVKCCLGFNLEDFNFFDLEILPTRENDVFVQFGVVRVSVAKGSATVAVFVAAIVNNQVRRKTTKGWTL
jgi:hypothetical protein